MGKVFGQSWYQNWLYLVDLEQWGQRLGVRHEQVQYGIHPLGLILGIVMASHGTSGLLKNINYINGIKLIELIEKLTLEMVF